MVRGRGIMSNVGRDITRGAVSELKRQVRSTVRSMNPINMIKRRTKSLGALDPFSLIGKVKKATKAFKGKGRRGRRGRGRPPLAFFAGSGRRRRRRLRL